MLDARTDLIFNLTINIFVLGIFLYATKQQIMETIVPKDWLTKLRRIILSVWVASIVGLVPVIVYQWLRIRGVESETLRAVAGVCGTISRLANGVFVLLIYTYKVRDNK